MATRALQDITNIRSQNIKLVIKKEEKLHRREILAPFLAYSASFYQFMDRPVTTSAAELVRGYTGEVSLGMRQTLVEWMYDVRSDFSLTSASYQLAVRFLDLYVAQAGATKQNLQLLGCVTLWIAQKVTECKTVRVASFIEVCDGAYTRDEFLELERRVLCSLKFALNYLLPMHIIKEDHFSLGNSLCRYASEALLLQPDYASQLPSALAMYIEENVLSLLAAGQPAPEFVELLTRSASLLAHQPKAVRDLLAGEVKARDHSRGPSGPVGGKAR